MELALRDMGFDASLIAAIHNMLDFATDNYGSDTGGRQPQQQHQPSRAFYRDNKAMRATAADILEYSDAYVFVIDMPGAKPDSIQVLLEDGNVLLVTGERRREKEHEKEKGVKYVRMERRQGKFMKRFELPENADTDKISAHYEDGVLTIRVEKRPLPAEPKKPNTIEVRVASGQQGEVATGRQLGSTAGRDEGGQVGSGTSVADQGQVGSGESVADQGGQGYAEAAGGQFRETSGGRGDVI